MITQPSETMVGRIISSKDVQALFFSICGMYMAKETLQCGEVKDLEEGKLSWIIQWAQCNHKVLKRGRLGLPCWFSGWESACQRRGQGFHPWSGTIPQAVEQLGPCATTTEPVLQRPGGRRLKPTQPESMLCNERSHCKEKLGPQPESSPHAPKPEKARALQWRPSTSENKMNTLFSFKRRPKCQSRDMWWQKRSSERKQDLKMLHCRLKLEGWAKSLKKHLEAGKGKEIVSPLENLEGIQPFQHLNLRASTH